MMAETAKMKELIDAAAAERAALLKRLAEAESTATRTAQVQREQAAATAADDQRRARGRTRWAAQRGLETRAGPEGWLDVKSEPRTPSPPEQQPKSPSSPVPPIDAGKTQAAALAAAVTTACSSVAEGAGRSSAPSRPALKPSGARQKPG